MSRLSLAMLFSIALAAGSAVAQTTTVVDATNSPYTIPGSTIAAGDTVRVVTGGSLDPSQGTVTNDGTLEYAPTVASGTMTLRNSLSGTGRVLKTGDGTLNLAVTNRNFAGDWRLQAGNVVTTLATHISGNSESTTNLLGTGEEIFEGNIFGRQGITGTGAFTVKGIGTPVQSGFQFMPYGYFSGANSYSGTTVLDGGVFIFNPMISTISTSAFGTSSVELRNAVTLMHTLGSSTPGHPQNVFTIPNGIVLGAGGGQTSAQYNSPSQYMTLHLTGVVSGIGSLTTVQGGVGTSTTGTGGNYLTFTEGTGTLAVVPEPATLGLGVLGGLWPSAAAVGRRESLVAWCDHPVFPFPLPSACFPGACS